MKKRSIRAIALLAAVILAAGIALSLSEQDVYAGSGGYPSAGMVYIGYGSSRQFFSPDKLYYKNGTGFTSSSSGANAHYDPSTGVLTLINYNGPTIGVEDGEEEKFTIKAQSNTHNTISGKYYGIVTPNIALSIDGGAGSSITVNIDNDTSVWCAGIANYTWGDETGGGPEKGNMTIKGYVDLKVNVDSATNGNGIVFAGDLNIIEHARVTVDVRTVSETEAEVPSGFWNAAVYGSLVNNGGHMTVSTDQILDIRMFDRGNRNSYAVYSYSGSRALDLSSGNCPMASFALELAWEDRDPLGQRRVVSFLPATPYEGYVKSEIKSGRLTSTLLYTKDGADFGGLPVVGGYFPDPWFRSDVEYVCDIDGNGVLDTDELALDVIDLNGDEDFDAYALTGIEFFTDLSELYWMDGRLIDSLDLRSNTKLKIVEVDNNSIPEIRLSNLAELEELCCSNNELTALTIYGCPELTYIDCSNNSFSKSNLLVPDSPKVYYLNISSTGMGNISYIYYPDLKELNCSNCGNVSAINLSNNSKLEKLDCSECTLTTLNVSMCKELTELKCWGCGLEELKLGADRKLDKLDCHGNQLDTLYVGDCICLSLAYLQGEKRDMTYYDRYVYLYGRIVLDVDKETEIETIYARCTSNALNLEGRVDILFYVRIPDNATGWTAKTFFESDGFTRVRSTVALDKSDTNIYDSAKNRFTVSCPNIEAKQMTEKAKLVVYSDKGEVVAIYKGSRYQDNVQYAARDWADYFLENTDDRNTPLAKALLNYGQTAQEYFNYKTERPAIAPDSVLASEMSLAMSRVTADSAFDMEKLPNAAAVKAVMQSGVRLNLLGDTELMIMFKSSEPVVKYQGNEITLKQYSSDRWYASIRNIASKNLGKKYALNITYQGKSASVNVCALSWANLILADSASSDLSIKLARSMYLYYQAADKYFNRTGN